MTAELADESLDLDAPGRRFESSTDFTIGLEEEFAILDPGDARARAPLRGRLRRLPARTRCWPSRSAGELIASEIEIRSGRGESFAEAVDAQRERRGRLFALADGMGLALGATGTHPWADYLDQRIIDTPHYTGSRRNCAGSRSATTPGACTSTSGVRGRRPGGRGLRPAARAAAGAARASRPTRRSSTAATAACTPCAPRSSPARSRAAGSRARSSTGQAYAEFVDLLARTGTVVESTQLWWSVRPHHAFGTVEVRICDAQTRGDESFALAGPDRRLRRPGRARLRRDGPEGRRAPLADREIEENLWRAIRYGMDGGMIDFRAEAEVGATRRRSSGCSSWTEPARPGSGSRSTFPERNGASARATRSRRAPRSRTSTATPSAETRRTYTAADRRA